MAGEPYRIVSRREKWSRKVGSIGRDGTKSYQAIQWSSGKAKHSGGCGRPGRRKSRIWNISLRNR